jgi:hypothetical protein
MPEPTRSEFDATTRRSLGPFAIIIMLAASASCTDKSDAERCAELDAWIEGRQALLDRECTDSEDCVVAFLRPDTPVATSAPPSDPQLARAIETWENDCGPSPSIQGTPRAVCVERTATEFDRDAPDTAITVELGRLCMLRGEWSVTPADAGVDVADDAEPDAPCTCPQCPAGSRCHACVCVADTACGDACIAADECGALQSLGLGADAAVCADSCDAALSRNPDYERFVSCLTTRGCAGIGACASLVP